MSWFEAFMISVMVIGIGGGIVFFFVHCFTLGLCDSNPKVMRIVDTSMIVLMIIGVFLFIPVAQYGGRNLDKTDDYSYHSNKDYSYDSDWGEYDYDDDGHINQGEWEDALGDYMDSVMP